MATTTTPKIILSHYHSVTICANLPKVEKDYAIKEIKDLPPDEYWLDKMNEKIDREVFKIQHVVANGPCQ